MLIIHAHKKNQTICHITKDMINTIKKNARLIKITTISVLSVLLVIVLVQNSSTVKFHFLFWTFTVSRYLFLLLLFAIGFIIGWLLRSHFFHRKDLTNITNSSQQKTWQFRMFHYLLMFQSQHTLVIYVDSAFGLNPPYKKTNVWYGVG